MIEHLLARLAESKKPESMDFMPQFQSQHAAGG
jgi:hypothetical protein